MNGRMKNLRLKLVLVFVCTTAGILVATWLMTKLLLPKAYLKSKINDLTATFDAVEVLMSSPDGYTNDTKSSLNVLRSGKNVAIMIMDANTQGVFVGDPLYLNGSARMQERMFELMQRKLFGFMIGNPHWNAELIRKTDRYEIYEQVSLQDLSNDSEYGGQSEIETTKHEKKHEKTSGVGTYIDLLGNVGDRYYVYLSIDYESITQAAKIATSYELSVAIIALFVAAFLIYFLCRSITRPIEKMSVAAERMSQLDFAAHCPEDRNDEIGELGRSLNRLSKHLEKTIGDLKHANNELERDIRKKEEIEEMRRDFISNVSHELKTPIALIQGYAEGLQDNIFDDEENRSYYCEVIVDEAAKMNGIVKKLLSLNQLEYGGQALEYSRFDIFEVLRGVLRDTEILQKQQGVTMHFYEDGPCFVWADEYRVEEVVTNYISNAFHHVARSKEIAVSVKKTDATVRISVYNTGEPIPEADIDKVWIKFYKVDKARTREYGGSGIGLSVVKAVMDAHGQQCGAINHEGGVEFWFELEAADGRQETYG